jgi:hypothetical protein
MQNAGIAVLFHATTSLLHTEFVLIYIRIYIYIYTYTYIHTYIYTYTGPPNKCIHFNRCYLLKCVYIFWRTLYIYIYIYITRTGKSRSHSQILGAKNGDTKQFRYWGLKILEWSVNITSFRPFLFGEWGLIHVSCTQGATNCNKFADNTGRYLIELSHPVRNSTILHYYLSPGDIHTYVH